MRALTNRPWASNGACIHGEDTCSRKEHEGMDMARAACLLQVGSALSFEA